MITRDGRGVFEAWLADGRFVRGWSPTVAEMAVILRRYGVAESELVGPEVSTVTVAEPERLRWGRLDDGEFEVWEERLRAAADGPELTRLREALLQLRSRIPADPVQRRAWLAECLAPVNAAAPQVGQVAAFHGAGVRNCGRAREAEARSECLQWVDPVAVISTLDRTWGVFDRMEKRRRSLDGFCETLLAADSEEEFEQWVEGFAMGWTLQLVELTRVEGPAGPVYMCRADGTHRAHFARVFGLPLMALVKTCPLPRELIMVDHPDRPAEGVLGEGFARYGSLWAGLRERGLLEVAGDPEFTWLASWLPTRLVGEWMLFAPADAVEANRAYDRVYPGALQAATGLGDELFDAQAWADLLIGDRVPLSWRISPPPGRKPGSGLAMTPGRPTLTFGSRLRRWVGKAVG
ncbi:hypothetical protein GFY24_38870 [Nocardia sp. SYP-A9097]|uniref:hypothetical protein n=1 Tax=Nocardia sp. SYP-A9097 TaxID=2663237 RepID=UPI00129B01ED|nr:hypothetical protein [Nocardia sp. SYP-A9097]MRH93313.1 hypothetical protein [Nocardia sp. SYP-A9097]